MICVLILGGAGVLGGCVVWVGFSISAVGGCGGTLGLFELVSSSCFVSSRSSLLPLMLSPSPSSDRVKSRDTSATPPFGMFTLIVVSNASRRTSGSCFSIWVRSGCTPVLDVSWRTVVFGFRCWVH